MIEFEEWKNVILKDYTELLVLHVDWYGKLLWNPIGLRRRVINGRIKRASETSRWSSASCCHLHSRVPTIAHLKKQLCLRSSFKTEPRFVIGNSSVIFERFVKTRQINMSFFCSRWPISRRLSDFIFSTLSKTELCSDTKGQDRFINFLFDKTQIYHANLA